jgi:hypothetical protein
LPRGPGAVARAGRRAQPSICAGGPASAPPTRPDAPDPPSPQRSGGVNPPSLARLRVRPSWHSPACGPSLFPCLAQDPRSGPASPPAGLAARGPHAPAQSLLWPVGRMDRHPPFARALQRHPRRTGKLVQRTEFRGLREVGSSLRPSGGAAMPPEAAGPERASRGGVSLARLHANSEGTPPRGIPARSQPEELRAAGRGGGQGAKAAHPRGKKENSPRSGRKALLQACAAEKGTRHGVARQTRAWVQGAVRSPIICPRSWPQAAATSRPLLQRTVTFTWEVARTPAKALIVASSGAAKPGR